MSSAPSNIDALGRSNPGAFVPGDPRRINRPKSLITKTRIAVLAQMEASVPEIVRGVIGMTEPEVEGQSCVLCGRGYPRSEETRLRAAQMILDRSGYAPTLKLETAEPPDTAWLEYTTAEEAEAIFTIIENARARIPAEVIEAEAITIS